ncbi:PAS domain S-box protein [Neobacillus drentensis]|uniref:PAS domain S-box protein n=1 Tax=Neobacillus drentensis TaxID=220684 RepID=UPI0028605C33|nr:PAS domain S-box protein [Neobacillus drentensis]MDR7238783.1 diguanylate cyclase (GGDEF)-like protein/PAS domain S-box-containing protein [Neobacillus drentensis]
MNEILKESSLDIYQSLIEHNPDAIFVFKVDGRVKEVNPIVTKLFGYSQEEIQGIHYQEIIVPEQVEKANDHFGQVLQGISCEDEIDVFHISGQILHLQVKSIPLAIQNEIVGIFCVAKDITKQRKLETSLKENEERYQKLVEYSPSGVLVHQHGAILYANPSALKLLKETRLIQKEIRSYIHSDHYEAYDQRVSQIEWGEELPFIEMKLIRQDGETIIAELGGVLIIYDGCPAILTLFRDISERKEAEQALHESEKQYRLLADNSLDLIQLVNLDGIVTYASPSHKTVLGYDPEEYVGERVFYQPDGTIDSTFKKTFLNMVYTHKSFTCEIIRKHKEDYHVWVELMGKPMFDKDGEVQHLMLVGHEITERKEYQKNLEYLSYHDSLTGIPNRRLFNERLEQTLKEAKRYGRKFAIMYMDMDNFKQINDTMGHDAGDELLKQFSNRVKSHLRESDILARQGGDEFTILLSEILKEEDALKVAERIVTSLQEPWQIDEHIFQTTSSVGIAFYPKDGITCQILMKHADIALYKAKAIGKNNIKVYS